MGKIGKLTTSILVLLLTVSSFVFGQKPNIQLSVNVKPIEVGQMVAFTVKSNVNGNSLLAATCVVLAVCWIVPGVKASIEKRDRRLLSAS